MKGPKKNERSDAAAQDGPKKNERSEVVAQDEEFNFTFTATERVRKKRSRDEAAEDQRQRKENGTRIARTSEELEKGAYLDGTTEMGRKKKRLSQISSQSLSENLESTAQSLKNPETTRFQEMNDDDALLVEAVTLEESRQVSTNDRSPIDEADKDNSTGSSLTAKSPKDPAVPSQPTEPEASPSGSSENYDNRSSPDQDEASRKKAIRLWLVNNKPYSVLRRCASKKLRIEAPSSVYDFREEDEDDYNIPALGIRGSGTTSPGRGGGGLYHDDSDTDLSTTLSPRQVVNGQDYPEPMDQSVVENDSTEPNPEMAYDGEEKCPEPMDTTPLKLAEPNPEMAYDGEEKCPEPMDQTVVENDSMERTPEMAYDGEEKCPEPMDPSAVENDSTDPNPEMAYDGEEKSPEPMDPTPLKLVEPNPEMAYDGEEKCPELIDPTVVENDSMERTLEMVYDGEENYPEPMDPTLSKLTEPNPEMAYDGEEKREEKSDDKDVGLTEPTLPKLRLRSPEFLFNSETLDKTVSNIGSTEPYSEMWYDKDKNVGPINLTIPKWRLTEPSPETMYDGDRRENLPQDKDFGPLDLTIPKSRLTEPNPETLYDGDRGENLPKDMDIQPLDLTIPKLRLTEPSPETTYDGDRGENLSKDMDIQPLDLTIPKSRLTEPNHETTYDDDRGENLPKDNDIKPMDLTVPEIGSTQSFTIDADHTRETENDDVQEPSTSFASTRKQSKCKKSRHFSPYTVPTRMFKTKVRDEDGNDDSILSDTEARIEQKRLSRSSTSFNLWFLKNVSPNLEDGLEKMSQEILQQATITGASKKSKIFFFGDRFVTKHMKRDSFRYGRDQACVTALKKRMNLNTCAGMRVKCSMRYDNKTEELKQTKKDEVYYLMEGIRGNPAPCTTKENLKILNNSRELQIDLARAVIFKSLLGVSDNCLTNILMTTEEPHKIYSIDENLIGHRNLETDGLSTKQKYIIKLLAFSGMVSLDDLQNCCKEILNEPNMILIEELMTTYGLYSENCTILYDVVKCNFRVLEDLFKEVFVNYIKY